MKKINNFLTFDNPQFLVIFLKGFMARNIPSFFIHFCSVAKWER